MTIATAGSRPVVSPPPFSYVLAAHDALPALPEAAFASATIDGSFCFYHTRDLEIGVANAGNGDFRVLVFGLVIDVAMRSAGNERIASRLASAIERSFESFLDSLDDLSGRFVVVFKRPDTSEIGICSDAAGMLKVNYRNDARACSSNIFLLARISPTDVSSRPEFEGERRKLWKFGSLGNLSPFRDHKILTPNHYLNLTTGEIERYFPRAPLERNTTNSITNEFRELCDLQVSLLTQKYRLYHSLSAGIDSRFSMALGATHLGEMIFFTYMQNESHLVDFLVSGEISKALSLNHYGLILGPPDGLQAQIDAYPSAIVYPDLPKHGATLEAIGEWTWYPHIPDLVPAYCALTANTQAGSDKPPLHIRSNLYEIGRSFWGKRSGRCQGDSTILEQSRQDWANDEVAKPIFQAFFQETKLQSAFLFDYDQLDMFYWEHRCGTWFSELLSETDFAFNSHVLINCRRLLKLLLSLDFEDRVAASFFHDTIGKALAPIQDVAINPTLASLGFEAATCRRADAAAQAALGSARST